MFRLISILIVVGTLSYVAQTTHDDAEAVGNAGIIACFVAGFIEVILRGLFGAWKSGDRERRSRRADIREKRHQLDIEKERTKVALAEVKAREREEARRPPQLSREELRSAYINEFQQIVAAIRPLPMDPDFKRGLINEQEDALKAKLNGLL